MHFLLFNVRIVFHSRVSRSLFSSKYSERYLYFYVIVLLTSTLGTCFNGNNI